MTTTIDHPARHPSTENWLTEIGATWTFEADLPVHRIDQAASLANQVRRNPLNADQVAAYTADMMRGDVFPPILVVATKGDKYAILGGNHRDAAHRGAGHATQPAYIVAAKPTLLLRIRVEDNRAHGLPLTTAERVEHGIALMDAGIAQAEAARIVGMSQPKLSIAAAVHRADGRAVDLDVAEGYHRLPQAVRYQLSQLDDDAVFTAAANLAANVAMPKGDVERLVRACVSVEPYEALRLVGQEEVDWADRGAERDGNVRAVRNARGRLDTLMAEIRGIDPTEVARHCPNADVAAVLAQRIMDTAKVLVEAHDLLTAKAKAAAA